MHKPGPTWATYRESIGDRSSLFAALAAAWRVDRALYAGSYLDLSPSTAIRAVTYVDTDARAARYFTTEGLAASELGSTHGGRDSPAHIDFLHRDYTNPLPVPPASVDLLISLYAGPVWDHCREYLTPGGLLLANTSHGDASIAALDPDLELVGAIHHREGQYRLDRDKLETYLVPKSAAQPDADAIRRDGRGIAYTRTAFAYVFQLRQR